MSGREPAAILITGASGAIGAALAEEYAAPGVSLFLHGRDSERLNRVAELCRGRGAGVELALFDLSDLQALNAWVAGLPCLPDLVIANAGMNINVGPENQGEAWPAVDALLDLNVRATMALVHAVLPGMRQRRSGQLALISSLAAYYGLPLTPSYSASKAAIKAYGEALRGWLAPEGVAVSVVMPGYVASNMCHEMPGPKPFMWSPARAAAAIRRGLARNKARISFPFPLDLGCWCLAVLPPALSQRILGWLKYRV